MRGGQSRKSRPRDSGAGRRFRLVLMPLRPATPRTEGIVAKHASRETYHWVLVMGRYDADIRKLARLLAVAYLDEASGLLGRGDPRWALPRAYLRTSGELETEDRPHRDDEGIPYFVRRELERIAAWLERAHRPYLEGLCDAFRDGRRREGFRPVDAEEARRWGFLDLSGRALLAPPPPPVVARTRPGGGTDRGFGELPWRRFRRGGEPGGGPRGEPRS